MEYEAEKNYGEATMEAVENFDGFNWNNLNERDDYIKLAKNYISFPEGLKQFINKKYGEICGIPESELHAFIEEHSRQRGVDLHKQTIGNWLSSDEKKKGRKVPGHMCAGCKENGMVLNAKEVEPVPMEED